MTNHFDKTLSNVDGDALAEGEEWEGEGGIEDLSEGDDKFWRGVVELMLFRT